MGQAPSWLNKDAKKLWHKLQDGLSDDGKLEVMATACQAFSVYVDAQKQLANEGRVISTPSGARKTNPWVAVEQQAHQQLLRSLRLLQLEEIVPGTEGGPLAEFVGV